MVYEYTLQKSSLPRYLHDLVSDLILHRSCNPSPAFEADAKKTIDKEGGDEDEAEYEEIKVLSLVEIQSHSSATSGSSHSDKKQKYTHLLLRRHYLTEYLLPDRLIPELILDRALIYEALGYADLALADAYVALTLYEAVLDPSVSDLRPYWVEHDVVHEDIDDDKKVENGKYQSLLVLCRCAARLGCVDKAKGWIQLLLTLQLGWGNSATNGNNHNNLHIEKPPMQKFFGDQSEVSSLNTLGLFGWCRRDVYPWNDHEPDRLGDKTLKEINDKLKDVAPLLEARCAKLPILSNVPSNVDNHKQGIDQDETNGISNNGNESFQLGLYALEDLPPNSTVLREKSALSAIRVHGDALCDACAADLENVPREDQRSCPACDLPFCSEECFAIATSKYHVPNFDDHEDSNEGEEETETQDQDNTHPPSKALFCPGTSGNDDISTLGRAESSTTPEWDLYFLLLSRTLQMAETQNIHPLDLFEIKYLWGDFSPPPSNAHHTTNTKNTLPYSIAHHIELPLQYFEYLMSSHPNHTATTPYSSTWLKKYDWWIIQTLYAKFRGVADAQQSSWTGKPEIAAVHPLWCLANHSCNPNVTWKGSGIRNLSVVQDRVWDYPDRNKRSKNYQDEKDEEEEVWKGIKKGEQIWNHYTDIYELDYRVRRERLAEVLGGECLCERCIYEEKEGI